MKPKNLSYLLLLGLGLFVLPGCISIPPLVQVEHKETINGNLSRRLDSIDHRLDKLEQKVNRQSEAKAR